MEMNNNSLNQYMELRWRYKLKMKDVISGIVDTKMNLIKDGVNVKNSSITHLRLSFMVMNEHFSNYLNQNEEALCFFQNFFLSIGSVLACSNENYRNCPKKKESPLLEIEGITFTNLFKSRMHIFYTVSPDLI